MKLIKIFSIIVFLILICFGLFYTITDNISKTGIQSTETFTNMDWLEFPVYINNHKTSALFDTGAQYSVLNESSAAKLNVISLPFNFIKVNNKSYHKLGIIKKLKINNLEFKNVIVILIDFKTEETSLKCIESEMILGMNIIKKSIWKFDNKNFKFTNLTKSDIDNTQYTNNISYRSSNSPITNIEVGKQNFEVLIDFGYSSALRLSFDKLNSSKQNNYINLNNTHILGKEKDLGTSVLGNFVLNKDTFENSTIYYSKSNLDIIGNQVFKHYSVVKFNPFKKELNLMNKKKIKKATSFFNHGFFIDKNNNSIIISYIHLNSPCYKNGLRLGDTITRINNLPSDSILKNLDYCSFANWRDKVFTIDTIQLNINRNGKILNYKLRKYKY